MAFISFMSLLGMILGLAAVASNPSPHYAALGLVVVAGMGCGVLLNAGGSFLCLVLLLVYLGGMLVVFAYSTALAADPHPEGWGSWSVFWVMGAYLMGVGVVAKSQWWGWYGVSLVFVDELSEMSVVRGDVGGVALVYLAGGLVLAVAVCVLVLTLLVVLELTRGLNRGALRVV